MATRAQQRQRLRAFSVALSRVISIRMKKARKDMGYTIRDVEQHSGISRETISRIERDRGAGVPVEYLMRLVSVYGTKLSKILPNDVELDAISDEIYNAAEEHDRMRWSTAIMATKDGPKQVIAKRIFG